MRNLGQPRFDLVRGGTVTRLEFEYEWGISLLLRPEAQLHFTRAALDGRPTESKVGVEMSVGKVLDLCFGLTRQSVSGGVGIAWQRFQLEPSFRLQEETGLLTRIGIRIGFGPTRREVGEGLGAD